MGQLKELFSDCELQFQKVVDAAKEKDPNALWLLFEYIEFRITKQREYENANNKRNSKKDSGKSDESGYDEEQLSFGFCGRTGH